MSGGLLAVSEIGWGRGIDSTNLVRGNVHLPKKVYPFREGSHNSR